MEEDNPHSRNEGTARIKPRGKRGHFKKLRWFQKSGVLGVRETAQPEAEWSTGARPPGAKPRSSDAPSSGWRLWADREAEGDPSGLRLPGLSSW